MDHMAVGMDGTELSEAPVKESFKRVVQMGSHAGQRVILVRISDFLELNVLPLERPRQKHALLEVHVVVQSSMHQHVRFVKLRDVVDVIHHSGCRVCRGVVVGSRQAHVALRVDRVVKRPVGDCKKKK